MTNDSNPFTPFTKLLSGLNPSDGGPGVMFPLSPFALAGGASGGTASPEEGTKRAVRQLYAVLAGISSDQPLDAWQQLLDTAMFDAPGFTLEKFTGFAATTYRIWFHSLSQMLVESFTLQIIHEQLVVDDHKRTTDTGRWLWRLPQADREQLLRRCTDVEDDLVDEMQIARHHRDELLYNFGSWGDIEMDNSLRNARQHLTVLTALEDHATEGAVFSYFPDGVEELTLTGKTNDSTDE